MTTFESLFIPSLLVPLLWHAVRSPALPNRMITVSAIFAIWFFDCLGAFVVLRNPALASDTYAWSMLLVIALCYAIYLVQVSLGSRAEADFSEVGMAYGLRRSVILIIALCGFAAAMMLLYISRHGLPPLLLLIRVFGTGAIDVYAIRAETSMSLGEGTHWYFLGTQTASFFAFVYAYLVWQIKRTRATTLVFIGTTILAVFFASSFANRGALFQFVIYLVLARACMGKVPRLTQLASYAFVGLGSLFIGVRLYLLDRSASEVLNVFGRLLAERLFLSYAEAHAYMVKLIPQEQSFFLGTAFGNPGGLLPFTPVDLSQFLGVKVMGHLANYSAPSFSQGWANFGYLGVTLVLLLMGLQLLVAQVVFRKVPKTPLTLALYVTFAERAVHYSFESLQNVMSEEFVLFVAGVIAVDVAILSLLGRTGSAIPIPRVMRAG